MNMCLWLQFTHLAFLEDAYRLFNVKVYNQERVIMEREC
jgi:hypothetical protein